MTAAGCARLTWDIAKCLKKSSLRIYGFGSRFNGGKPNNPTANSDWDLAVVCSDEEWETLVSEVRALGFYLWNWLCGGDTNQPVVSNYPDPCFGFGALKNKNEVDVRRIATPDLLKGDWTEIV